MYGYPKKLTLRQCGESINEIDRLVNLDPDVVFHTGRIVKYMQTEIVTKEYIRKLMKTTKRTSKEMMLLQHLLDHNITDENLKLEDERGALDEIS